RPERYRPAPAGSIRLRRAAGAQRRPQGGKRAGPGGGIEATGSAVMGNKILIIAEHDGGTLNPSSAKTVHCAAAIGGEIHVAVFAVDGGNVAAQAAKLAGVTKVLMINRPENAAPLAAVLAPQ